MQFTIRAFFEHLRILSSDWIRANGLNYSALSLLTNIWPSMKCKVDMSIDSCPSSCLSLANRIICILPRSPRLSSTVFAKPDTMGTIQALSLSLKARKLMSLEVTNKLSSLSADLSKQSLRLYVYEK